MDCLFIIPSKRLTSSDTLAGYTYDICERDSESSSTACLLLDVYYGDAVELRCPGGKIYNNVQCTLYSSVNNSPTTVAIYGIALRTACEKQLY